jgi:FxsC-like protein
MDYWFFFSYAHADDGEFLRKFYKDLDEEVRQLTGAPKAQISFLDREAISHGATWDAALEKGLKTCRVFVPLYSSAYFNSPYCGKEFAVFRERLHAHLNQQGAPIADTLILPLLWNPEQNVLKELPASINKIQYTHGSYPLEYTTVGVSQLVRLGVTPNSKYYNEYWDFIRKFATNLQSTEAQVQMVAAASVTALDKVTSAFSTLIPPAPSEQVGPRYVQFIFIAGKQPELQAAQRKSLQFYGQKGGSDWQPYLNAYPGDAAALAADVIAELPNGSQYEEVTTGPDIQKQIQLAAKQDKIVVVMVDTWTLRLEKYCELIAPLDNYSSVNCITLIAWNEADQEASVFKGPLEAAVNGAFTTKVVQKPANFLSNTIKSYATFKEELIKALTQAQSQIVETAEIKKNMQFALVNTSDEVVTNPLR